MSTKIYTGFRIETTDLYRLRMMLQDFRQQARPVADRLYAKVLAAEIAGRADRLSRAAESIPKDLAHDVLDDIRARQKEIVKTQYRDPEVDFGFEIWLYPTDRGDTLGMFRTEQEDLEKLWRSFPGVIEYGYQNQTDRPEDISETAWNEREQRWNQVLGKHPGDAPWDDIGLKFAILKTDHVEPDAAFALLSDYWPDLERRARTIAFEEAVDAEVKRRHPEGIGESYSKVAQVMRWARDEPDGQAAVEKHIAMIRPTLMDDLDALIPARWREIAAEHKQRSRPATRGVQP